MCERYALPDQPTVEREFLPVRTWWNFTARFNVAAGQYVPAIRLHDGETEAVMMRWGFIPAWAEGKIGGAPALCVKAARLDRSNKYREPWLAGQRCILPAAGFYTWQVTEAKHRQPFFVTLMDRSVFGLAAVWDRSVSEDDDVIESCAVVCVAANELLRDVSSPSRWMPAILSRKNYGTWLRGTPAAAKRVLEPYSASRMHAGAVSPRINSLKAEGPELIRLL